MVELIKPILLLQTSSFIKFIFLISVLCNVIYNSTVNWNFPNVFYPFTDGRTIESWSNPICIDSIYKYVTYSYYCCYSLEELIT
jgi:hypothetical protein